MLANFYFALKAQQRAYLYIKKTTKTLFVFCILSNVLKLITPSSVNHIRVPQSVFKLFEHFYIEKTYNKQTISFILTRFSNIAKYGNFVAL